MLSRLMLLAIVGFFATMNVLLWRVEFGESSRFGSPVPLESVVERILTAPDDSSLEIRRGGERIGYCHWIAGTAEELVLETPPGLEGMPDGMVSRPKAYAVHVEGGILTGPVETRARFSLEMKLNEQHAWRELVLRLGNRPDAWEVRASAISRVIEVGQGPAGTGWSRRFTFEELDEPGKWALELGGPALAAWLPELWQVSRMGEMKVDPGWQARTDWVKVGGMRVQVFRLTGRISERHEVTILVSRVGEIMRVELPGGFTLVNEVLVNL
jgi:hypothetical protein